jgi:hypothetical protein
MIAVAFCGYQLFKPRLPQYSFQIQRIIPKFMNRRFKAKLGADVKMQNDNYVPIDIHALSFDIFYPDWNDRLHLIGHVHDTKQHQEQQQYQSVNEVDSDSSSSTPPPPLWALLPRKLFETRDDVMMQPHGGLGVLTSLSWDLVKKWGMVEVPSSGVIHAKAHSRVPLTLSILCANTLNTWTLEMVGRTCNLDALAIGWDPLPEALEKLRTKVTKSAIEQSWAKKRRQDSLLVLEESQAQAQLQAIEQSSGMPPPVGRQPLTLAASFEEAYKKLVGRMDWEDVLPMLAIGKINEPVTSLTPAVITRT